MYMSVKRLNINFFNAVVAALLVTVCFSCKKKEETKSYLDGSFKWDYHEDYGYVGGEVFFHVSGVSHPEGKNLYLTYTCRDWTDTLKTPYDGKAGADFSILLPYEYGTYSLSVTIFPEDKDKYYSSTFSRTLTAMDPEKSLPEIKYNPRADIPYTDERDGVLYPCRATTKFAFMRQNLYYEGADDEILGVPYVDRICDAFFGRFYTWEDAMKACPEGWELPSDEDFTEIANMLNPGKDYETGTTFHGAAGSLLVDAYYNGVRMWAYNPDIPISKNPTFHAIPVGFVNATDLSYTGFGEYACFWTKDTAQDKAAFRYIHIDSPDIMLGYADKNTTAMSVRCVRKQ